MVTITGRCLGRDYCGTHRRMFGPIFVLLIASILPVSAQKKQTDELFYDKLSEPSSNPPVDSLGVTLTTEFDADKWPSSEAESKKKHGKSSKAKKVAKKKKKKKKYMKAKRAKDGTMHCHYKEYFDDAATEVEMSTATGRDNGRLLSHHDPAYALDAVKDAVNAPSPSPPVWRRQEEVGASVGNVSPEASTSEEQTLYYQPMLDTTVAEEEGLEIAPSQNEETNDFLDESAFDQAEAQAPSMPHDNHIYNGENVAAEAPAPIASEPALTYPEADTTVQMNEDLNVLDEPPSQEILTQLPADDAWTDEKQENTPSLTSNPETTLAAEEKEVEPVVTAPEHAYPPTVGAILSVSEKRTDDFGDYVEVVQVCPPGFDYSCSDLKFSAFDESIAYKKMTIDMSLLMEIENGATLDIDEINKMLAAAVLEDIRTCGTRRFLKLEDAGAIEESMPRRLLNIAAFSELDVGTSKKMDGGSSAISFVEESIESAANETNSSSTSDSSETSSDENSTIAESDTTEMTRMCFGQHRMEGTSTECAGMYSSWTISIIPDDNNSNEEDIKTEFLRIVNKLCALRRIQRDDVRVRSCATMKAAYVDQGAMFEAEEDRSSFSQIQSGPETVQRGPLSPPGIALIATLGVGLLAVVLVGIHKGRAKYKETKATDEWNGKDGRQGTDVESTLASNTPRNVDDLYSPTFSSGSALDGNAIVQDLQGGDGGYEIPFAADTEQDDTVSL